MILERGFEVLLIYQTMTYPSSNPVNKHDLVSTVDVSVSRLLPSLEPQTLPNEAATIVASPPSSSKYTKCISTIYTYSDAPSTPRPLYPKLPIFGFCTLSSIGLSSPSFMEPSIEGMTTCRVAVKRADGDHKRHLKEKDIINCQKFSYLCKQLRDNESCAYFLCAKTHRAGFIVAMDDTVDGGDYAAYCLVADVSYLERILCSSDEANGSSSPQFVPTTPPYVPNTPPYEANNDVTEENNTNNTGLWQPPSANDDTNNLWQPSTPEHDASGGDTFSDTFIANNEGDQKFNNDDPPKVDDEEDPFHGDSGARAADNFYSNLTRSMGTRADSSLYHMRNFNGWVKATQIAELDPLTINSNSNSNKRKATRHPLRVLDLACGKGGDLGKWVLHKRGIANYVGVDVARGSLVDAAIRARKMKRQFGDKCVFTCADLGADVPGRLKTKSSTKMQKLSSWSLKNDDPSQDPKFSFIRGGGISETDKFDVVSIQFAIHYMMSSVTRARRFFHTVSELLEIGGNLIATTIDSRVVMQHMMNTGYNFHFDEESEKDGLTVSVGNGACQLKFQRNIVEKIFTRSDYDSEDRLNPDYFGLEYTFTLVEGEDHAAGVGQAVDLPEWLTPLPVLTALAKEAGLELEYASNFHDFFNERTDHFAHHAAHGALYNMNVLNRSGTISHQEWEISRMYMAVKFRKKSESKIVISHDDTEEEESDAESESIISNPVTSASKSPQHDQSKFFLAMKKARQICGSEWQNMNADERNAKTKEILSKL